MFTVCGLPLPFSSIFPGKCILVLSSSFFLSWGKGRCSQTQAVGTNSISLLNPPCFHPHLPTHLDLVLAEARKVDVGGSAKAVHSMKQNLGVLGDLQFFNEGPGSGEGVV